jgi:GSH-dependent disulfide-bond oxidoreductase
MMKLYAFATPNNLKAVIALEELALDYEIHSVNIRQGEQKTVDFLKINPNAKVPVLDDQGFVLTESAAILVYLAEREGKFLPSTGPARARVFEQLFLHASGVSPAFGNAGFFQKLASEKVPFAIDRFLTESKRLMSLLNEILSHQQHMAAQEYTIADMAHFGWLWRSAFVGVELSQYPHVEKWYAQVHSRKAVQRAIQKVEALVPVSP